jgi:hypothetical protein
MLLTSPHAPAPPAEKGIPNIADEITSPMSPAMAELATYHSKTAPANRPARPRRSSVPMAGLSAAKMSIGTSATMNRISEVVPVATGASRVGKAPPKAIPKSRASSVHT